MRSVEWWDWADKLGPDGCTESHGGMTVGSPSHFSIEADQLRRLLLPKGERQGVPLAPLRDNASAAGVTQTRLALAVSVADSGGVVSSGQGRGCASLQ